MIYLYLCFSELPRNQLFSSFDCSTFRKPACLETILLWCHKGLWLHHQVSDHTSSLVLTPPPWDGLVFSSSQTCGWSNKTAALLKLKLTQLIEKFDWKKKKNSVKAGPRRIQPFVNINSGKPGSFHSSQLLEVLHWSKFKQTAKYLKSPVMGRT